MQVPVRFLSPNQWGFVCWKTVDYCIFGVITKNFTKTRKIIKFLMYGKRLVI